MEDKLLYKDLTYIIRGVLFSVHNKLGQFRNEKQYCDAIEDCFKEAGIKYARELVVPQSFDGERRKRSVVDFLIDNAVVLEVKQLPSLSRENYFQCQRYLVGLGLELALLVNFRTRYLTVKRVLNHTIFKN